MSVSGTGVAAGVAQTAYTAQQVSREREKRVRDRERPAERLREVDQTHLKVLEEQDGEATPRLAVDDQMQERHPEQAPGESKGKREDVEGSKGDEPGGTGKRLDVRA